MWEKIKAWLLGWVAKLLQKEQTEVVQEQATKELNQRAEQNVEKVQSEPAGSGSDLARRVRDGTSF